FCIWKPNSISLQPLILPSPKTSGLESTVRARNTHWVIATTGIIVGGAAFLAGTFPLQAGAFWQFFTSSTRAATEEVPYYRPDSTAFLAAATHPDPDPNRGRNDIAISEGSALVAAAGPEGTATLYKES